MSKPDFGWLTKIIESLSEDEKAVRLEALEAILAVTPVSMELLSQRTGLALAAVAGAITRLKDIGLVVCEEAGPVVGSWGLTLVPTSYRLKMLGRAYYTWCAEDAVGIPAALSVNATVNSSCFGCGQEVAIAIRRGAVVKASPPDIRLWIADAEIGRSVVGCT